MVKDELKNSGLQQVLNLNLVLTLIMIWDIGVTPFIKKVFVLCQLDVLLLKVLVLMIMKHGHINSPV